MKTGFPGLGLLSASLIVLSACSNPELAVASSAMQTAIDLGPSSRAPTIQIVAKPANQGAVADVRPAHDGHADTHATGVVNKIDADQRRINVTHEPILAIGWPSMTMDFPVTQSVDLSRIKPGSRVNFTLEKGKTGLYEIESVQSAAGQP